MAEEVLGGPERRRLLGHGGAFLYEKAASSQGVLRRHREPQPRDTESPEIEQAQTQRRPMTRAAVRARQGCSKSARLVEVDDIASEEANERECTPASGNGSAGCQSGAASSSCTKGSECAPGPSPCSWCTPPQTPPPGASATAWGALEAAMGAARAEEVQLREAATKVQEELRQERQTRRRLEQEVNELRQRAKCIICFDRARAVALQPCFHLVICEECKESLGSCPVCRVRVHGYLKIMIG